ncbi:MAG: hypothetical protein M1830_007506 [Pleopsidium flavum]|nr:MAG: hypothetical protein M1830_007506 [Pleopsidium flavum]
MFPLRILLFFIGPALAVPLTSENINLLERRAPPCNVRYGWSLSGGDCMEAASKLSLNRISVPDRILTEPGILRSGTPAGPSTLPGVDRVLVPRRITAQAGNCVIGVNPTSSSSIGPSDWDSIMGKAYNILITCVMPDGQGGKATAGVSGKLDVMIWQEDHFE